MSVGVWDDVYLSSNDVIRVEHVILLLTFFFSIPSFFVPLSYRTVLAHHTRRAGV